MRAGSGAVLAAISSRHGSHSGIDHTPTWLPKHLLEGAPHAAHHHCPVAKGKVGSCLHRRQVGGALWAGDGHAGQLAVNQLDTRSRHRPAGWWQCGVRWRGAAAWRDSAKVKDKELAVRCSPTVGASPLAPCPPVAGSQGVCAHLVPQAAAARVDHHTHLQSSPCSAGSAAKVSGGNEQPAAAT